MIGILGIRPQWQPRVFTHFLHCAVVNAHILYKLHHKRPELTRGFICSILLTCWLISLLEPLLFVLSIAEDETGLCYCGLHAPVILKSKTHMINCKDVRSNHRKYCKVCKKLSNYYSKKCNVALCLGESLDDAEIGCFEKYHTR